MDSVIFDWNTRVVLPVLISIVQTVRGLSVLKDVTRLLTHKLLFPSTKMQLVGIPNLVPDEFVKQSPVSVIVRL